MLSNDSFHYTQAYLDGLVGKLVELQLSNVTGFVWFHCPSPESDRAGSAKQVASGACFMFLGYRRIDAATWRATILHPEYGVMTKGLDWNASVVNLAAIPTKKTL